MAGSGELGPCPECGTKHAAARGYCEPLEKRRGPSVLDANHPSNNGAWARVMAVAGSSRTK